MFVLVVCLLLPVVAGYCEGSWEQLAFADDKYHIDAARTVHDPQSNQLWLAQACPAQIAVYTCYFHGNASKSAELERRRFVLHGGSVGKETCEPFFPIDFLQSIRGKRLVLIGDSIMGQLWVSLVCTLHSLVHNRLDVEFGRLPGCNDIICPDPHSGKHSFLEGGWMHFPSFNATISHVVQSKFDLQDVLRVFRSHRLGARDIVTMNFGVHYNREEEYDAAMKQFRDELLVGVYGDGSTNTTTQNVHNNTLPRILYFQSAPQHFRGSSGYYDQNTQRYPYGFQCEPVASLSLRRAADWRNRVIDRYLSSSPSIHIVRIAEALYSQYDAHIGLEPYVNTPIDCTHWCFPSGIFKYLHLMLHNAIHRTAAAPLMFQESSGGYFYGPALSEGDLVRGRGARDVYLLQNGKRFPFNSLSAFVSRGYDFDNVVTVADAAISLIPLGVALT